MKDFANLSNTMKDSDQLHSPWPAITDQLTKKYTVIDWFKICCYDISLHNMVDFWKQYKDYSFKSNERIVVIDTETQYYPYTSTVGDTLYNLFLTLNYFNISTDFLIFLSNCPSGTEIKKLAKMFTLPEPTIHYSDYFIGWIQPNLTITQGSNIDNVNTAFICLNGMSRAHRVDVLCLLKEHDLFDKGIVTYNFLSGKTLVDPPDDPNTNINLGFRTTIPWARMNEVYTKNKELHHAYSKHANSILNLTRSDTRVGEYSVRLINDIRYYNFIQQAAIYFAMETVMNYPHPFITEKTWLGIIHRRPFVVAGPAGVLKRLHSMGFKTFNGFWDESYDDEPDTATRICQTVDIIKQLCNIPVSQLRELVKEMDDILEHNLQVFHNKFSKTDLQTLLNQL